LQLFVRKGGFRQPSGTSFFSGSAQLSERESRRRHVAKAVEHQVRRNPWQPCRLARRVLDERMTGPVNITITPTTRMKFFLLSGTFRFAPAPGTYPTSSNRFVNLSLPATNAVAPDLSLRIQKAELTLL